MISLGFHAKSLRYWSFFVLVLSVPSIAASISFSNINLIARDASPQCYVPSVDACGFKGDGDTYGLGIRIGFYLQWISVCLAVVFYPDEAIALRGANSCFQASMLFGLIYNTVNNPELYAAEALLVVNMGLVGISFAWYSVDELVDMMAEKYSKSLKIPTIGALIWLYIALGYLLYAVWFFYVGMNCMKRDPCSTYTFLIAKVDIYGSFRTFAKVFYSLLACLGIFLVLPSTGRLIFESCTPRKELLEILLHGTKKESPLFKETRRSVRILHALMVWVVSVFFIIGTELVLEWNNVYGVSTLASTGQILPVVVAVASILRVVFEGVYDHEKRSYEADHPANANSDMSNIPQK
ncbi:hypothetical protein RUND412_005866 [Rhizina undulata]